MNRKFVAIFGALLFLAIGATIAYNSDSGLFANLFHAGATKTSVIESFVSPTNWLPCQTADKVITVRNDGNVPVAARIKIAESWKNKDGNELALTFTDTNGATQRLALININTADWEKRGAYYYYKTDLAPGETSTPFMTDVTLNCAANLVDTPYLGGTYTLSAAIQTIEANNKDIWINGAVLAPGETVNGKLKALAGNTIGDSLPRNIEDSNIKTILDASALPANFDITDEAHIISAEGSEPIYAWFDNTDNAGAIHIYSNSHTIKGGNDMTRMFMNMRALTSTPAIADWDTSNVASMVSMFAVCSSLTSLDVSNWDTSNVTTMRTMFSSCSSLTSLDVSSWDTSNVTDIAGTFQMTSSLTALDVSNWNTSNVTDMSGTFYKCSSLTSLDVSNWDTSKVTTIQTIFYNCSSLTSLDVSNWDTSNVTDMAGTFYNCLSLTSLDVSNWDTSNATDMRHVFFGCSSLTSLDVSNWDTSNATRMRGMFGVGESYVGNGQLAEIIGLENFDTSNVTDMTLMFSGAGQMTHYNISGWNVSKVESFNNMFADNFSLKSLDLSRWDVSSVKTMYNMFDDARSLTTIGDISHWNTTNLVDAGGFLNGATSFIGDNGTLDLSGWNTSNLLASGEMFRATLLTTVDLRGWNFDKLTNDAWDGTGSDIYSQTGNNSSYPGLSGMFLNMPNLQNVYIDQDGKDSFDAAVARGVNVDKFWQGSPISDFTVLSN
jgi:alternate signal-mediated exported protein